jgi:hypothetical protein
MQGATGPTDPATQSQLTSWVKSNHTNYSSFKSPDDTPLAIHDSLGGVRKTLYVIEWQTMKILQKSYQDDASTFTFMDSL